LSGGTSEFETEALTSEDASSGFQCGKAPLDEFLAKYAGQNQRAGVSRTWVLRRPAGQTELPPVLGYYTLTLGTITREDLPDPQAKRLPRYPVPVALIGRLARDIRARGQGVGERLLVDAHLRVLAISEHTGCVGVLVDAKDAEAEAFYGRYTYQRTRTAAGWPMRMYLAVTIIREALASLVVPSS